MSGVGRAGLRCATATALALTSAVAGVAPATAQAHDENAMFGGDASPTPGAADPTPTNASGADLGDARMAGPATENQDLLVRDRLQIGGLFYARQAVGKQRDVAFSAMTLAQSNLVDVYLDGRVNERVRAYLRGRLSWNPLADVPPAAGSAFGGAGPAEEVRVGLDQLWLKWDVGRTAYFTLGSQHVRYGATRIWNPGDVVNRTRRNPLQFFDERSGVPMLKVHVPYEARGWNFYGLILTDDATTLDKLGAIGRAEIVVGPAEVGLTGLARKGDDPRLALDLSAGVWELDLMAETGLQLGAGEVLWQASAGVAWTWPYREDDSLTLALEWFHNPQGFESERDAVDAAAKALLTGAASPIVPLYTGRDYLGLLAVVVSPGDWKDVSVSAIALASVSDRSGLVRLAVQGRVLTDLGVEAFVAGMWGEGEFSGYASEIKDRLAVFEATRAALPRELRPAPLPLQSANVHGPLGQVGLNLRVDL
ncbi:MAG: hypothetical protein EXR79_06340 [Myxococcales bacterium]|nr:hypothetical protein [Myxococcales bacterium]